MKSINDYIEISNGKMYLDDVNISSLADSLYNDLEGEFKDKPMLPKYRLLPKGFQTEDFFIFFHVGASIEESSNYNSLPRPMMLLIQENEDVKIIRKKETLHDLIAKEISEF